MGKLIAALVVFSTITFAATPGGATNLSPKSVLNWAKNLNHVPEKLTKLHFFSHHLHGVTASTIAKANSTDSSPTYFGLLDTRDDPLTIGPEDSSEKIGYAQGLSAAASVAEITSFDAFTFGFTNKEFNGSTLTVVGSCPLSLPSCEAPVAGGSGFFRLARGVVTTRVYYMNFTTAKAILEINVVALHY